MTCDASIIICTRNRADSLRQTLAALSSLPQAERQAAEVLVVDNASTDSTPAVVIEAARLDPAIRYLREPRRGQAKARNTGIAAARGHVILFTDDDVRPQAGWIEGMRDPILRGEADALAGGVTIPTHLRRSWMGPAHLGRLACTDWMIAAGKLELVGANMAFSRDVLRRVPGFDPDLGPGALGLGDDSLFSWQIREAGLRLQSALDVAVEHHFDPERLLRRSFRQIAKCAGESRAYLAHHWEHRNLSLAALRCVRTWMRLAHGPLARQPKGEGIGLAEMQLLEEFHFRRRYLQERRLARNYERHGLTRLLPAAGAAA